MKKTINHKLTIRHNKTLRLKKLYEERNCSPPSEKTPIAEKNHSLYQ